MSSRSQSSFSSSSVSQSSVPAVLTSGGYSDQIDYSNTPGYALFRDNVQPLLASRCSNCHLGARFGIASLTRSGSNFSAEDTAKNYRVWADMLSLDSPAHSRLLAKILPESHPNSMPHRPGPQITSESDALFQQVLAWAQQEKQSHCSDCGSSAARAWIAFVRQPEIFWMIASDPVRIDRGTRTDARIMMQEINPATNALIGSPFDFLETASNGFCSNRECDFGNIAINYRATQMVFECRLAVNGESWLNQAWNICIADIGSNGAAVNPRFLMPANQLHQNKEIARNTPFGKAQATSVYDKHYIYRTRNDKTPIFSSDDSRIVFASARPDPRSGINSVQTYHGTYFLENIVSVTPTGTQATTIYRNEGGSADNPFYLRNGNIAFHTWNLDRMDRHMYTQAQADGMMEVPILGGRVQGQNAWGKAFESNNGAVMGLTGRRRGELENYAPFVFDHTMGISTVDNAFQDYSGFQHIPAGYLEEIADYPSGYCKAPPEGANCTISKILFDPYYMPGNRALIAYNPEKTYIGTGESFALSFMSGSSVTERQNSVRQYLPKKMGIGTIDQSGNLAILIQNETGYMYRYPAWVGPRQHPRLQEYSDKTNNANATEMHIADFKIWLAFQAGTNGQGRVRDMDTINRISALRVLRKIGDKNACIQDSRYILMSNMNTDGYHPSALGIIDSTGYEQFVVPSSVGGNSFGDIPLNADGSVKITVPAGELLLFQGVDDKGKVMSQHERVFSLPGGRKINTSVKQDQYYSQCASCHGVIDGSSVQAAREIANLPAVMDFNTQAASMASVDLTGTAVSRRTLTYLHSMRPIIDSKCMGCHQGENPDGNLNLESEYSTTANYPPAALESVVTPAYQTFMANQTKIRSHKFSVNYSWLFDKDNADYKSFYANEISNGKTLGELAPWDSAYQNLFRPSSVGFYFLNSGTYNVQYGRARSAPSNSSRSYLMEVLTGENLDAGQNYAGTFNHVGLLTEDEVKTWMAVMDVGLPYMARCDEKTIPSGVHAGKPWGDID
ncbi:MAG: hypothetical protein IPK77_16500 [Cellvibrio sp.]|nr:hypothetical protein [Cellvibrio sp.]